jgi:hypothetical protein
LRIPALVVLAVGDLVICHGDIRWRNAALIFEGKNFICRSLLVLAHLFGHALNHVHQLTILVKLKQLFVTVVCKTCFNQSFEDCFYLLNLVCIDDWVNFVPQVSDVGRCWRETMAPAHVG